MAKNKKQKALAKARKDGKISGKEARQLSKLGISNKQISHKQKGKVTIGSGASKYLSKPKSAPKPQTKVSGAATSRNSSNGNKFLTPKMANQIMKITRGANLERQPPSTTTNPDGSTTTNPGDIDWNYYQNQRLIGRAVRGLKKEGITINNVNSQNDLNKIRKYAQGFAKNYPPHAGTGLKSRKRLTDLPTGRKGPGAPSFGSPAWRGTASPFFFLFLRR